MNTEDLKKRFTGLDTGYKIGLLLLVALTVGFVANSFSSSPVLLGADHSQVGELDKQRLAYDVPTSSSGALDQAEGSSGSSDRKIVTTVRTTLKVSDVAEAQENTRNLVEQYNGFIESSSIDQRNEVSGSMTVAIPDENLSAFTSGLEDRYKIESQNTDRSDVTDRYNELESELSTKKQEMQQLRELMNRSENVSDLIKVQERMSELRSRIDYLQKQLDDLDERVTYSKVYIDFEGPELLRAGFNLRETFYQAYRAVFDSVRLIILGTAYLLPFLIVAGLYKLLRGRVDL